MPPQSPAPQAQQSPTGQTPAQLPDQPDHTAPIEDAGLSDETRPVPRDRGPVGPEVPGPATAAETPETSDTPVASPPGAGPETPAASGPAGEDGEDGEDGETQDIRFAPGAAPGQRPPPAIRSGVQGATPRTAVPKPGARSSTVARAAATNSSVLVSHPPSTVAGAAGQAR